MSELHAEFFSPPEGLLRDGSVVIRPSLRAALERFLMALLGISMFFAPFYLLSFINIDAAPSAPGIVGLLDSITSLILPLLLSVVPAAQLLFTRYIVDDEGIRERVQLLSKTEKRVPWDKVTALHHRRTIFDWMLGIQRLDVIAYGARGTTIKLVGLTKVHELRQLVAERMRSSADVAGLLRND
jgi:hypothetical protein